MDEFAVSLRAFGAAKTAYWAHTASDDDGENGCRGMLLAAMLLLVAIPVAIAAARMEIITPGHAHSAAALEAPIPGTQEAAAALAATPAAWSMAAACRNHPLPIEKLC